MGRSSRKSLCDRRPASGTQAFRYAGVEDTVVVLRPFKDSVVYRFQYGTSVPNSSSETGSKTTQKYRPRVQDSGNMSGALLHNTAAQDTRERPLNVSFEK
ncbi:hypothetical protein Tco_1101665 [Tanacetum coccineum]